MYKSHLWQNNRKMMFLCNGILLVILFSINKTSNATRLAKYRSFPPGKVTKPAGDILESLQVKIDDDCLLHCQHSDVCTAFEVSASNGQYTCTLRELFSEDPVNQVDSPGAVSYLLG